MQRHSLLSVSILGSSAARLAAAFLSGPNGTTAKSWFFQKVVSVRCKDGGVDHSVKHVAGNDKDNSHEGNRGQAWHCMDYSSMRIQPM